MSSEPFQRFKRFSFDSLDPDVLEALEARARETGRTVEELIWDAVDSFVMRQKNMLS
jgi:hypothetical protein